MTTPDAPLLAHAPAFTLTDAERFARELFAKSGTASPLTSERDQNFLITCDNGDRFVLKISNALEAADLIDAQQQAMARVADRTGLTSRTVAGADGSWATSVAGAGAATHIIRLVTYVPGTPAGNVARLSPEYRFDLGRALGAMDRALEGFDHPAAHRDFYWDLGRGTKTARECIATRLMHRPVEMMEPLTPRMFARVQSLPVDQGLQVLDDLFMRSSVPLLETLDKHVIPRLRKLPHSVIHGDANDFNVIVRDEGDPFTRRQQVAGIVDWGDMVYTPTICNVAIGATYAALGQRDVLAAVTDVVRGYHSERALREDELAVLWQLVHLRLLTSRCVAIDQTRQRPSDAYLGVSQDAVRDALPRVSAIPTGLAEATLRLACGFEASSSAKIVRQYVTSIRTKAAPIFGTRFGDRDLVHVPLDIASPMLSGNAVENIEPELTRRVFAAMADAGATVGYGGYGEARLVYASDLFADDAAAVGERRTIHLGVDLFAPAGTPVHAPLAGTVHIVADNDAPLDYGPLIILEHRTDDDLLFYTLYGHLSRESLQGMQAGRAVRAGDRIATLGDPSVNGGWTPHLHFQLITDLLGLGKDYPGVSRPTQAASWLALNPDPSALLGVPPVRATPSRTETLQTRRQRLGGNLSIAYREPVKVARGWMQYLYDDVGRQYLDGYNNVPHVGHSHPAVVRAAQQQLAILNTNTRYPHDAVNALAERICATMPAPLSVCYFVNSGSEANDLALRLARAHTGRRDMIVLEAAYHGITLADIDISPYKHDGPGGSGAQDWVHTVPVPDVYRGQYRAGSGNPGQKYATHVRETITHIGHGIAGFIAESLPSVGGQIVFPDGYLSAVYEHVRASGGVCIADEVQTGYGRIGTHFWGFEQQGVVPDIVVLGKPMGNGYPIGAVVTTAAIAKSFDNGMEFFSTFGGSTVSAVVGLTVLDVVQNENLQAHAREVGDAMLRDLRGIAARHPLVGDVRGSGLFLGVELVRDRETLDPAPAEASYVVNRMREEAILLGTDGPHHNVIKIRPPMPFNAGDATRLVETLDVVLRELI